MTSKSSLRRFLAELKRRKVYRVSAVYAGTAFVLWQVADFVLPALGFPGWSVDLVVVLTLLGFPVAVVLAWAFEVTAEGVRRTEPAGAKGPVAEPATESIRTRTVLALASGLTMLAAGGWWLYGANGGAGGTIDGLAVLPVTNMPADPDQAYFVQGMHDRLISELQQAGLPVKARTSVLQYADGRTPPRQIARELDVDRLVEMSVFRMGDSVEIEVRLVDPTTQDYLWTDAFGASLEDVIALHRRVTRSVAEEIHAALGSQAEARLARADRVDPEAFEAYLQGEYHLDRFTPGDFDTALRHFERAVQIDSTFAPAWVGIGRVWLFRAQAFVATGVTSEEASEHWKPALERALDLNPDLADAHSLRAAGAWSQWEYDRAAAAYRRAIELNPGLAQGRASYGHVLTLLGRWDEARQQVEAAAEIDPYNPFVQGLYATQLYLARRHEAAIEVLEEVFRRDPDVGFGTAALLGAYEAEGRLEEAYRLRTELAEARNQPDVLAALERGYGEGGYTDAVRRAADVRAAQVEDGRGSPFQVATLYARVGANEEALRWLEDALELHEQNLPYMGVLPFFEDLHDESRFQELTRRVGVPILQAPTSG